MTLIELLKFYLLFVKISVFTFGGGYAMIPLFQDELVNIHGYLTEEEFANLVSLAQITPGPIGINAATFIGWQQGEFLGALAGTLGVMTPSLILVTLVAFFIVKFKENPYIKALLSGIRPMTLGLIAAAVVFFAQSSMFSASLSSFKLASLPVCWQGILIFLVVLFIELRYKVNIVLTLLVSGLAGYLLFLF